MTSDFHAPPRTLAPLPLSHSLGPPRPIPRISKRSNACTACKTRKIKCRGSQPCDNCAATNRTCVFLVEHDRRRKNALRRTEQELKTVQQHLDRILEVFKAGDKTQLDYLLATAADFRTASASGPAIQDGMLAGIEQLSDIPCVDGERRTSEGTGDDFATDGHMSAPGLPDSSWCTPPTFPTPSFIPVGTSGQGEFLTVDPNRSEASRATGYIGSSSEIAWLQELGDKVNSLTMHKGQQCWPNIDDSAAAMNYHLDYIQLPETIPTDPRSLPPKPWATTLVGFFFEAVYPSFPVVNKSLFIIQFEQAYTFSAAQPSRKWLAVLNLILALGSRYYQETEPDSGRDVDDRVNLSRALALASTPTTRTSYAGLQQVQVEVLLAIYYLASGQVNQSWQTNGRAARSAISMGLNLWADGDQIDPVSKETRTRIWWSIFNLEHVLSGMTGRPPCIDSQSMSVRLPLPFDEAQFQLSGVEELLKAPAARECKLQWTVHATDSELDARDQLFVTIRPRQSLYFFHLVDLSVIMQAASRSIYGLTTANDSVEGNITFYRGKLKSWLSSLQPAFAFTTHNASARRQSSGEMPDFASHCRERTGLALAYYSSQVVLTRPCLTYPEMQMGTNAQTSRSRFGDDTAKSCVHFALALVSVLPDQPDMKWISKVTSWWCLLHSIMRALTVLLIQLSVGQVPVRSTSGVREGVAREGEGIDAVRDASKKILLWLHSMAKQDPSSKRAFHIGQRLFSTIARTNGFDLQGVASVLMAKQEASRLADLDMGSFCLDSLKLQGDFAHWGPDVTGSESGYEQDQVPFVDPALLSFKEYRL
ncbi:Zn(II)2Cys6 transcription factor [Aspergillus foveolatus]|uniref:Zn(II)2Cys6 transcription factor n=1 Tax=Aspergillus foveolatus TaxID=210207 RepID=UPI003CCCF7C0